MAFPVQSNFNSQSASSTTVAAAFSSGNTLGNILVVAAGNFNGSTTTTATIADSQTNTYVQIDVAPTFQGQGPVQMWWVSSCKAGANTVTVTWSAASAFTEIVIVEYAVGAKPANVALDSHANNAAAGVTSLALGPISPVTTGDLLVSYSRGDTSGPAGTNTPTGFTVRTAASFGVYADLQSAGGGSTTVTWGWTASQAQAVAVLGAINQGQVPSSQGTSYPVPFLFPGY